MRLISFDVGIKNLAYCVFSINESANREWSILNWNCVNLIANETNIPIKQCCHKMRGKRKYDPETLCNKNAKWASPENMELVYCEVHAKSRGEFIVPKKQHSSSHLNKLKLAELEKEYATIFDSGDAPNLGKMKKSELMERITHHYKEKCYVNLFANVNHAKTAGEIDLITIGRAIRRQLDGDHNVEDVTHVIIENQISTIASRMKTIQGMIAQYFIMRFGETVHIEFVSSQNKLKGFSDIIKSRQLTDKKTSYKANKSDGILICSGFFQTNPEMEKWLNDFDKSKKRDDLADCFLQGIWYAKTKKIIYNAEDLKINIVVVS